MNPTGPAHKGCVGQAAIFRRRRSPRLRDWSRPASTTSAGRNSGSTRVGNHTGGVADLRAAASQTAGHNQTAGALVLLSEWFRHCRPQRDERLIRHW